jgi:hypothetical protein
MLILAEYTQTPTSETMYGMNNITQNTRPKPFSDLSAYDLDTDSRFFQDKFSHTIDFSIEKSLRSILNYVKKDFSGLTYKNISKTNDFVFF